MINENMRLEEMNLNCQWVEDEGRQKLKLHRNKHKHNSPLLTSPTWISFQATPVFINEPIWFNAMIKNMSGAHFLGSEPCSSTNWLWDLGGKLLTQVQFSNNNKFLGLVLKCSRLNCHLRCWYPISVSAWVWATVWKFQSSFLLLLLARQKMEQILDLCYCQERPEWKSWLLTLAWSKLGHCRNLVSVPFGEMKDISVFFSVWFYLSSK